MNLGTDFRPEPDRIYRFGYTFQAMDVHWKPRFEYENKSVFDGGKKPAFCFSIYVFHRISLSKSESYLMNMSFMEINTRVKFGTHIVPHCAVCLACRQSQISIVYN